VYWTNLNKPFTKS